VGITRPCQEEEEEKRRKRKEEEEEMVRKRKRRKNDLELFLLLPSSNPGVLDKGHYV